MPIPPWRSISMATTYQHSPPVILYFDRTMAFFCPYNVMSRSVLNFLREIRTRQDINVARFNRRIRRKEKRSH